MKTDFVRIVWHQLTHQKGLYLALIWGVAMFATGCGKKESAAPSATTAAPEQTATQETAAATAPSHPADTPSPAAMAAANNGMPVLQQLNRAVLQYKIQNHRNPTSVEEVAAFAGIQVPPPPPGKKYVFNGRGLIVLVDDSTK
jgi:hypothetical protein